MFNSFGPTEIIVIAILLLVFFGGRKIPEFIKGLGQAVREFKNGAKEEKK